MTAIEIHRRAERLIRWQSAVYRWRLASEDMESAMRWAMKQRRPLHVGRIIMAHAVDGMRSAAQ